MKNPGEVCLRTGKLLFQYRLVRPVPNKREAAVREALHEFLEKDEVFLCADTADIDEEWVIRVALGETGAHLAALVFGIEDVGVNALPP